MSDTLLIHYNINSPNQATWSTCNYTGALISKVTHGSLSLLKESISNQTLVVLLHSQCLHITQQQLPTHNTQKLLKVAPFAIEEFIAQDIDDLHFVVAKNKKSNQTNIVSINKQTLSGIIQAFQNVGIVLETIIPDSLCLPANQQQWVCLKYNDDMYLQNDVHQGAIYSTAILPKIIQQKLKDENSKPERILFFDEGDNLEFINQLKIDTSIKTVSVLYNTHPLVLFCENFKQAMVLNLLQHEFKHKRKSTGHWQYWRFAAVLATIWFVASLILTGIEASQLKKENNFVKAQIEKIYKNSFPKSKKIVNPRIQMERKLEQLRASAGSRSKGLLFLLGESFGHLKTKHDITLQSIKYKNNRVDVNVDSPNLQALENLNRTLNSNIKIKSVINSSSSEKNKVSGNLKIESRS